MAGHLTLTDLHQMRDGLTVSATLVCDCGALACMSNEEMVRCRRCWLIHLESRGFRNQWPVWNSYWTKYYDIS